MYKNATNERMLPATVVISNTDVVDVVAIKAFEFS